MNVAKHCVVILLAIIIGLSAANGIWWLYIEMAGPFYPDSSQQQRNFDNYLIDNLLVIVVSGIAGYIVYGRRKHQ